MRIGDLFQWDTQCDLRKVHGFLKSASFISIQCLLTHFRSFCVTSSQTLRTYLCEEERVMEIYEKKKKPHSVKINTDACTKRITNCIAATPARQSDRVSKPSRTLRTETFRLFQRARLAVGACSQGQLWPTIPPALPQFASHVSPNPHLQRASAADSRRPAAPTSRVGPAKRRLPHL